MSKLNSPEYQFRSWRTMGIERQEIESFCHQVLALCDHEYVDERERLREEKLAIVERLRRKEAMERGIDEAPGVILSDSRTYSNVWCHNCNEHRYATEINGIIRCSNCGHSR